MTVKLGEILLHNIATIGDSLSRDMTVKLMENDGTIISIPVSADKQIVFKLESEIEKTEKYVSKLYIDELYIRIGRMIANYRKEKNMKQEELSMKIGVDRCTLSLYESGKVHITISRLYMIADIFGESIYSFLPDPKEIRVEK